MEPRKKKAGEVIGRVSSAIAAHSMIKKGETVVVAVSGGPDSVCLLDVLSRIAPGLGASLVIAHYNHCLRPSEDESESAFLQELSLAYGLPLETGLWEQGPVAGMGSREDQARKARYAFLHEVLSRRKAERIAVGHNLNDQAETLLIRLLRGSGPQGLSCMRPAGPGFLIRPLLDVSREEILAYLEDRELRYMVDSSNMSGQYLRNKIRLRLIPLLEEIQPAAVSVLSRVASIMREDEEFILRQAEEHFERTAMRGSQSALSLSVKDLLTIHPALAKRVLRRGIEAVKGDLASVGTVHLDAVLQLAQGSDPSGEICLPHGIRIRREYERLCLEREDEEGCGVTPLVIEGPGVYTLDSPPAQVSVEEMDTSQRRFSTPSRLEAYLDADKIDYPIKVRSVLPGDRFVPMGMSRPKRLKEFFIDCKVPKRKRPCIPLFESAGTIVWVGGMRVDERFRAAGGTRRLLRISLSFKED
jgi:tRNA(Ile)-lysidine synthase